MVSPTSALNSPTGVLSVDQLTALDAAVAPLNPDQLIWASGYVAGLAAALRPSQTTVSSTQLESTSTANVPELAIVYGSQTGHSEAIAETLHQSAQQAGFATKLLNMSDLSARKLAKERWVALVVSTHGEGDPPDDAIMLLEQLGKPRAPSFTDTQFSVLALGDSSYAKFCQTGKDFEAALVSLGANSIAPIVECDVDYQTSAAEWRERVLTDYASLVSADSTRPALHVVPAAQTQLTEGVATVVANQRITGDRSSKVVHHLELAFDTPLDYQPGDSVGLKVTNPDIVVTALLAAAGLDGDTRILFDGSEVALFDALKTQFEATRISGPFLDAYARLDGVQGLSELLADPESKGALISSGHIADV
ncbi:MAG: flavodoxin domain-containing protein, partial [Pseudomonadota bacterium]